MENDYIPDCNTNDDISSSKKSIIGHGSTNLGSAMADSLGSRQENGETPSKTPVLQSPTSGETAKQLEKDILKNTLNTVQMKKVSSSWKKFSYTLVRTSASRKSEKGMLSIRRERMTIKKNRKLFKFDAGERNKGEEQELKPVSGSLKRKRLKAQTYKKWLVSWAKNGKKVSDLVLERRDQLSQGGQNGIDANGSKEIDERAIDVTFPDEKVTELSYSSNNVSLSEHTVSQQDTESHSEHIECVLCKQGGELLWCDGQGCKRRFHISCLDPPLTCMPPGIWHCIRCVKKKIESGVHSVSEGIDSIMDSRDVVSDHEGMQKQYLVKYKGLAPVHGVWIPARQLLLETPILLTRYNRNQNIIRWKSEWTKPQRVLQKRLLSFPEGCDGYLHESDGNDGSCRYEWLVKWTGLSYNDATWELENASFLRSPEALKLIKDYESRHNKEKRASRLSKDDKLGEFFFRELSESSFGGSPGVRNSYLTHAKKLCEFWYRGQNAVVIDYQERVVKVILFILSVQDYISMPLLVITPSTAISVWEVELLRCASSANIVVYKGNKDVRASIRSLEFCNKSGCIMFDILVSSPDVVVEDLKMLECVDWEAIIIDECQRPTVSCHLKDIKMLAAEMKMLLVSGQIKDRRGEYQNLLSILDSGFDDTNEDSLDVESKIDICSLKEKLAEFVAYECKSSTSKFVEYWVPVRLSNVQLEQYCASLLSNSMLLSSCLKNDPANSFYDILHLTRKCCDHPYLVDQSLQSFITRDLSEVEYLEIGIKASGKLQFLDKVLLEIKKRGLRVLIMFQSLGVSGLISLGDILDDFVHQRFGKDSYARIGAGEIVRSKKQATVNTFNNKESGKFVFLIENRACVPSIKLSSIDLVILFGSDWDPLNDLRALQKITIDSQFEQLKVFRLYSSCTVEEKLLMLTKQGVTVDSNLFRSQRTCNKLLTWGASYLFNKLDNFHDCDTSVSWPNVSSEQSLLDNVLHELSALLPRSNQDSDPLDCSMVLKVQQSEGVYPINISLFGELETQSTDMLFPQKPHVFWKKLLEDRHPRWKFLSEPSKRIRKNVQIRDQLIEEFESAEDSIPRKHRKVLDSSVPRSRSKIKRKLGPRDKEGKLLGSSRHSSGHKARMLQSPRYSMHNSSHFNESLAVASDISRELVAAVTLKRDTVKKVRRRRRAATPIISQELERLDQLLQLPASSNPLSTDHDRVNLTVPMEIVHHQNNGTHATGQGIQISRQPPIEDSIGLSIPSFVQPSMDVPVWASERDDSNLRTAAVIQESLNNHSLRASFPTTRVPESACLDPLQVEMERIRKDDEKAIKIHADTIMCLKDERGKEIDAIHKRYDSLFEDADKELVQKRKDLETCHKQVFMHKLLAEALRQRHDNAEAAVSPGTQNGTVSDFMNEILQLYLQQNATRTTTGLEQSSACLPATGPPVTPPEQVTDQTASVPQTVEQSATSLTVPPVMQRVQVIGHLSAVQQTSESTTPRLEKSSEMSGPLVTSHSSPAVQKTNARTGVVSNSPVQVVTHPSELFSPSLLSSYSNPLIPRTGGVYAGTEVRAPAPHLRRFRPPPSVSSPNLPIGMPSQQSPSNPPLTYSTVPVQLTSDPHGSSLSSPELPISIVNSPDADLCNRSLPLSRLDSTHCAI